MQERRAFLKQTVQAATATLAAPMINRGHFKLFAGLSTEYSARAIDLVKRSTIIDMLSPLTLDSALDFARRSISKDSITQSGCTI